ncbi:hypothetical protein Lbir_0220 [Legionella birminghamensis]|uniref:Dot/Icm T4SS effector n=1 Tax=Legionella birminghamensis TaxID=28083 RepID=A0A378IBS9_9GAMM|nr:hypothetical protein [Legionella birminghamensis]KTC76151.1 hypothetical protein Lbir_0220 [Legionella birminghamensis]STX32225.1 Uncharacterised protein [Legionella birminghamensis]
MPFKIPSLEQLIFATKNINTTYKEAREEHAKQQYWFTKLLASQNLTRTANSSFVEAVGRSIYRYKGTYHNIDKRFKPEKKADLSESALAPEINLEQRKNDFLTNVLAGTCIYVLHKITSEYGKEEKAANSKLAETILKIFDIKKISDIPEKTRVDTLNDLHDYIEIMGQNSDLPLRWHEGFPDDTALMNDLFAIIKTMAPNAVQHTAQKESSTLTLN